MPGYSATAASAQIGSGRARAAVSCGEDGAGAVSGGQGPAVAGLGAARPESAGAAQDGCALIWGKVITGLQQAGQQLGLGGEGATCPADGHGVLRSPDDLDAVPGRDLAGDDHP